jgi:selenocysteine-specific elongation factor
LKPIVLGTAGHIDHGKTALVRALTGIDCDRLPEEKARGITIELGFAHLELDSWRFGIVDVPGHERFVRAMVAGAAGIDLVMLVIAADEGPMPQTQEHLDICSLLGVPRGLVALTKSDLCEPAWLRMVTEDVGRLVRGTFLEGAPIVPCSATTGAGLDDLRAALLTLAPQAPGKDADGLLRLPLDRAFVMKGFGTVVTGTLVGGRARIGDDVLLLPSRVSAKVRGLQVHGEAVGEAIAGQRTAVNLGGVERADVERGEVLVHAGTLEATSLVDGFVRHLSVCKRPLKQRARVLFHAGTTQVMGTVVLLEGRELPPGAEGPVQLHLEQPVVTLPGDRFILRGFEAQQNYGTTLGGGEVVRVRGTKHRRADAAAADLLRAFRAAGPEDRVALEVRAAGLSGIARDELKGRLPLVPRALDRALERLGSQGVLVRFDREQQGWAHRDALGDLRERIVAAVDRYHAEQPLRAGAGREEIRSKLPADLPVKLFHAAIEQLVAAGDLDTDRESIRRRGHRVQATAEGLAPLKARVEAALRAGGLSPPRPAEIDGDGKQVQDALRLLIEEGAVVKVQDLYFCRAAVDDLRARLVAFLEKNGQITAQQWKDLCAATRKFTIPLGEHFDAEKLTLRVGDARKLRGR